MRRFDHLWDIGSEVEDLPPSRDTSALGCTQGPNASASFDEDVQVAEIRLLDMTLMPSCSCPRYIAVVDEWDEGLLLVLPFAPYSVPAVTGEFVTGRDHFSLAVLEA